MPDETTPEQPDDVPPGSGGVDAGAPESWDHATQAIPADTGSGDATQAVPADTTRSMETATPPVGTPAAGPAGAVLGAGAAGGAPPARARPAPPPSAPG